MIALLSIKRLIQMATKSNTEDIQKHKQKWLAGLIRGDIIKNEKENTYYLYSGDIQKMFFLNSGIKQFFSFPNDAEGVETITYDAACDDSCKIITEQQWISGTEDTYISLEDYNRKVLQVLLPGDIVQIRFHYLLYIGNGKVIHLIHSKGTTYDYRKEHKEEFDATPQTGAIVTKDDFLRISNITRACKKNIRNIQGLPVSDVIRRAESQLGPANYNMFTQNSKHFVHEMKYGTQISAVVRSFAAGKPTDVLF